MMKTAKQQIIDKSEEVLELFQVKAKADGFSVMMVNKVKKAYIQDLKNYSTKKELLVKPIENSKNKFQEACYLLGQMLKDGYTSLSTDIKKSYIYDCFKHTKISRCFVCGRLLVSTLKNTNDTIYADIEHVFPKHIYPQYSLYPLNMIPCCMECNQREKGKKFFDNHSYYFEVRKWLKISKDKLPVYWENIKFEFSIINPIWKIDTGSRIEEFLNFYGLEKRYQIIISQCYEILIGQVYNNIKSPESLEVYLEQLANTSWGELNDGYSFNNYPHIWQQFIESILYDENKLFALWEELRDYQNIMIY